ncbi:hypothetical protein [Fervidicoccus fontis]|uniref:CopG domain protein DNA-binding domain protein n=1 Tax=Fervidicoccus fontis (strain DSM 19380 / JCM 18336 / VKM B-2539 / Kam940) TaxID=1163730 RepID=I0A2N2_FERFK|nr:hypothetical protein [Fervidicoccus fontis]AFH43239.1 CopG domain protein DNA-binding domain protein [Fervidicoccus fontis Kam940]
MSPMLCFSLTEEQYKKLQNLANSMGYSDVGEFVKQNIFNLQPSKLPLTQQEVKTAQEKIQLERDQFQNLIRTIQDLINPFTAKIDELTRSFAELKEEMERIESKISEVETRKELPKQKFQAKETQSQKVKPKAIERLKSEGVVFQKDLSWLNTPRAFFERLRKDGAVVMTLGNEYVAIDRTFWEDFKNELSKINERNADKVSKMLSEKMAILFKRLLEEGKVMYVENEGWVVEEEGT